MKKILSAVLLLGLFVNGSAQASPEKFAQDLMQVSQQYNSDMRFFLKTLPTNTTQFNDKQQNMYCGIVGKYVNGFYQLVEKYRADLPPSYARFTKQDVVRQVEQSKEMQILKRYNIQCNY